ncbi:hypothetical protein DFH08DRAFT_455990 [Mycena albidolilacea]|uniref:Uncharacterized protein n=1 Tax=Mycena albidolilacea TaxID=1033008 RepID=A0AAD6Z7A5_9AGAR|nr:hypothetical protein DFH08DRAFT_455990 [Mycena albidolilacea]
MHLIWENLVKNLVLLWTGGFKGLDEGTGEYELTKTVWEAIASQTSSASDTIPSAYGSRIPNIAKDRPNVSAEMWYFWTLYLGPVLLRRRFCKRKYYTHFIDLVRLLNICMQFEISDAEIEQIRTGFIAWVEKYEELYFQYDVARLATCPLTAHALLHIAPSIKFTGPVWCYWAFPMERYCGSLQPGIRSRRFPWASMDRYVLEKAQLTQIMTTFNTFTELSLVEARAEIPGSFSDPLYPSCILLPPKSPFTPGKNQLTTIAAALSTRCEASIPVVNTALRGALVEEWGKVRRVDSEEGDTIRSCSLGSVAEDSRDATYVRYQMLVDENARYPRHPIKLKLTTFYGQLTHIYRVHFPSPVPDLAIDEPTTYIFAAVQACNLKPDDTLLHGLDIHFYSGHGHLDVVDITSLQALVGWVPVQSSEWAVVDRSGVLARAQWLGEDENGD